MVQSIKTVLAGMAACTLLSACGSSGSGGVDSAPPPIPTPSPTPTPTATPTPTQAANDTSVELLATPATQELAVATRDDPLQIRYNAARSVYELKAGTIDWSVVVDNPEVTDSPNRQFRIAGQAPSSYLWLEAHNRDTYSARRYQYSNLAYWQVSVADGEDYGNIAAIGAATPASAVPVSGTASFEGLAVGQADVKDTGWGMATTRVEGTVKLNFDFAAGALSGSLALATVCDCTNDISTGTIAFSNTVYSRGSQTFSGGFATSAQGTNAFEGRFTGPGAEELIGSWALPFLYQGTAHQAWGAWIAKREN